MATARLIPYFLYGIETLAGDLSDQATVYGIETNRAKRSHSSSLHCMQPITVYGIETNGIRRIFSFILRLHAAHYRLRY